MKLTGKTDIEAPISFVFSALNDYAAWESEARSRGVEVERPADMPLTGEGAGWRVTLQFRGKVRKVLLRLDAVTPDTGLAFSLDGKALGGLMLVELLALSPRRTRLKLVLDLKPKTLAARLFLNAVRLAKGRTEARLEQRLAQVGTRLQQMFQKDRGLAGKA